METWATTRDLVAIYAVRRRRRVNDRGVATIHSHVVVWISSHSGREKERERERERERSLYSPSYKRSFRFGLQKRTRDVDGWRTPVYDKARETPLYPKLNLAAGAGVVDIRRGERRRQTEYPSAPVFRLHHTMREGK